MSTNCSHVSHARCKVSSEAYVEQRRADVFLIILGDGGVFSGSENIDVFKSSSSHALKVLNHFLQCVSTACEDFREL